MKNIPTKKFKATFEFEAIPYNKETFELLGPCFMEEYPETLFAREDVFKVFQKAFRENLLGYMRMLDSPNKEYFKKEKDRFNLLIEHIRENIKIEVAE